MLGCCCRCLCLRLASSPVLYQQVGLSKVLHWVKLGLLDANQVITMKVGVTNTPLPLVAPA